MLSNAMSPARQEAGAWGVRSRLLRLWVARLLVELWAFSAVLSRNPHPGPPPPCCPVLATGAVRRTQVLPWQSRYVISTPTGCSGRARDAGSPLTKPGAPVLAPQRRLHPRRDVKDQEVLA